LAYFAPLRKKLEVYLDDLQIEKVYQAYLVAEKAHETQVRSTGEPYITHPVAVACILAAMRMDIETLIAALLHDVLEDCDVSKETLAASFGSQVAELVDGVSKLTQIHFESRAEAQAENFRKMVLAMAKDLRVIIIKLADRLHNMRTLDSLKIAKRKRIALETLEIYAPIANRLGMHNFRIEYEDLGFAALYPMRYRVLSQVVQKARGNRREILSVIDKSLREALERSRVPIVKLWGREKHLYSIYKKMRNKRIPFSEIMDVYAFRIITEDIDQCYRVLGAVHNLYKPVPERFKDYIAIPKANGYQSLHTTLFGPYGVPIEIQIRTEAMNYMAESGIASHWFYKAHDFIENKAHIKAQEWLKNLLEMQQSSGNSLEFIENVKIDLFPDEVYVFTPKGNILALPKGSSAIDFAYAIHTDIGDNAIAARIDRRIAPLSSQLENGQTVEVLTSPTAAPNVAWLNFVVTAKARSAIRHRLKHQKQSESIALGKRLLERALSTLKIPLDQIPENNIQQVLIESQYESFDELLMATGLGNLSPLILARRLAFATKPLLEEEEDEKRKATQELSHKPLLIKGTEGMVIQFAMCCRPIPGDSILGVLDAGRGITVHTQQCLQIKKLRNTEKYIFLSWENEMILPRDFQVDIQVELVNQKGVLAALASAINDANANIENVVISESDGHYYNVKVTLSVQNRVHLARVMKKIRLIPQSSKLMRLLKG
jgi:GTP diphosphokinase / guanosine-3',5'-bis(diphosphate) 3'-diphosphatase